MSYSLAGTQTGLTCFNLNLILRSLIFLISKKSGRLSLVSLEASKEIKTPWSLKMVRKWLSRETRLHLYAQKMEQSKCDWIMCRSSTKIKSQSLSLCSSSWQASSLISFFVEVVLRSPHSRYTIPNLVTKELLATVMIRSDLTGNGKSARSIDVRNNLYVNGRVLTPSCRWYST